ncbi:MAG: hypothetical protein LBK98_03415 [Peptococcaceae bacterium]|jgi:hypothetical protein|nr:hypothetical protein [Peptococcaceae bacterium]
MRRILAAAMAGLLLLSGCVESIFLNQGDISYEAVVMPGQSLNALDPREVDKFVSDLPIAFAVAPNCLDRISFQCVDFDAARSSFIYTYQYTYADANYLRRLRDYELLSETEQAKKDKPKTTALLTVLASHNYVTQETTEFFRRITELGSGGVSVFASKPPDMDGYALYFEKHMYYFDLDGVLFSDIDFTWAYDQLAQASLNLPERSVTGAFALSQGERAGVSFLMTPNVANLASIEVEEMAKMDDEIPSRHGLLTFESIRLDNPPAGYDRILRFDLATEFTSFKAKSPFTGGEVQLTVPESGFGANKLSGYSPATEGKEVRLAPLEEKYVVGQPLPAFQYKGEALFGNVIRVSKVYEVIRVPRSQYISSYYYDSSVLMGEAKEYWGSPFYQPPAAPEPEEKPEEKPEEGSAEGSLSRADDVAKAVLSATLQKASDVLGPFLVAAGTPLNDQTAWRSLDEDYTGWLRTVWDCDPAYRQASLNSFGQLLLYTAGHFFACEDVRVLAGYEIEIDAGSYVRRFSADAYAAGQEKPLAGGNSIVQAGDSFYLRDPAGNISNTTDIVNSSFFDSLTYVGTPPAPAGYAVITDDADGSRIHLDVPYGGGRITIPFQDVHFIPAEERGNLPDEVDPTADAAVASKDFYAPERILALGYNDFLLTSLKNGAVRYSQTWGGFRAVRILEAPLFRSWRLSDGSFIAVGFELKNPAKRYSEDDMIMARVLTYNL